MSIFDDTDADRGTGGLTEKDKNLYGDGMQMGTEMFPPEQSLREVFHPRVEDEAVALGLSLAQQQAKHREFVGLVRETGIEPTSTGKLLYNVRVDAELAAARGEAVDVDAQRRIFGEESRRQLRETYGAQRAEDLLARTEQWLASQPKLKAFLSIGAIGSDPKIVSALVEHVRKAQFQ